MCATSYRCAFDLIVSNRINLYYKRHLDSNTVPLQRAPIYHAITYSPNVTMTAAEHKSDFELTKDPVSRASYGVFVVGIWGQVTSL